MQFSEEFLYHIWDAQHLSENLATRSGKKLNIKFPGRWNTDSGADFKDAVIEINGEVLKGDIELDITTYQWKSHSHNENPEFNDVLLHVVYKDVGKIPFTINEDGNQIEILELKDQLDDDINKLINHYSGKTYSEKDKTCLLFNNLDEKQTNKFLISMGMMRFEKKIKRFSAEHFFSEFDQLLYMGFMEALGYSKNKYQMLQIALNIPFKNLKEYYDNGMTKDQFISMLICSSGLIDHLPSTISKDNKAKWEINFKEQSFITGSSEIKWKLFRIRPVNHPAIRILQVADLLYDSIETSFFHNVLKLFSFPTENFILFDFNKKLYHFFQIKNDYLPENYKLGKTRIDTILVNIILPLIIIYAREKKYTQLENTAVSIYENFPGLPANYLTQYMEKFLNIEQKALIRKRSIYQQGLLNIYYENCQHHYCEACKKYNE
ncbi:MAG: DUF2851 family protein [Candidatus Cloacimonetes bacterium]|jgi:hypothetical protein|nr:DUF2851 family protein [Candidatus Cloacimonadota bacterium]